MSTSKKILYIQYVTGRIERLEHRTFDRLFGDIAEFKIIHPQRGGFDLRDIDTRNEIMAGIDGVIFGQYLKDYPGDYLEMEDQTGILTFVNWLLENDFPILGICSGHQLIAGELRGVVVRRPAEQQEQVGIYRISLTEEGKRSPLYQGVPATFWTFANHQDTLPQQPAGTQLLASSDRHQFQSLKYSEHIYTCQFHPDVDYEAYLDLVNPYPEWWKQIRDWPIVQPLRSMGWLKRVVGQVSKQVLVRTNKRMQTAPTSNNHQAATEHKNLYYPVLITRNWIEQIAGQADNLALLEKAYSHTGTKLDSDQIQSWRAEVLDK